MNEVALKQAGKLSRLTNATFRLDPRIGEGFYTANYFLKVSKIATKNSLAQNVTMQWFQRQNDVMLCGIDEALAIVKEYGKNVGDLKIYALNDGDMISAGEPVLKISGAYTNFGYLENVIDAVLARRTSVATNALRAIRAANGKEIFSMADRQDEILTQMGDGYASFVAGIRKVATDAQGAWWGGKGAGTMPHALIQMCGGDLVRACELYTDSFAGEAVTALVDYNNDVITDALKVARALGSRLGAVRVDTSKNLIDKYFTNKDVSGFDPHGVCKELIFALRDALDKNGAKHVKIIVSSGFDAAKIAEFEAHGTPVDVYGVGSYLTNNTTCGFTGDLVELDGVAQAKFGRALVHSDRLELVKF